MTNQGAIQEFVDRCEELDRWRLIASEVLTEEDPKVVIYRSRPSSGLTRFLRECALHHSGDSITFFVDGSNQVANSVFSQILFALKSRYPELWKKWQGYIEAEEGHPRKARMIAKLPNVLPYVGTALSDVVEEKVQRLTVSYSDYPSALAELLCRFLSELAEERRLLVFIDDAQDLEPWSMDLLRTTGTGAYSKLAYILGFVRREEGPGSRDIRIKFEGLGYEVVEVEFTEPDASFVRAVAGELDVSLDTDEARRIASHAEGDIHHVLGSIHQVGSLSEDSESQEESATLRESLLRYLHIAEQSLRVSDLIELCSSSPEIFLEDSSEVSRTLEQMDHRSLINRVELPDGDQLVTLDSVSDPQISALESRSGQNLVAAERLYNYFLKKLQGSGRHSEAEILPLLYRLSREVDQGMTNEHAERMVRLALQTGSLNAAREFIDSAISPDDLGNPNHYFLRAAFLLAVRDYERALGLVDDHIPESWRDLHQARLLRAISLNRCRAHWKADELIGELLDDPETSAEERVILASYRISGRLHEDDVSGARQVFEDLKGNLDGAGNYGQFLRNAASAMPPERAVSLLTEAVNRFEQTDDQFGKFTAMANRGGFRCETLDYEAAREDLEAAKQGLEPFGSHHVHIVENNIGLCYTHLDELERAHRHLQNALRLVRSQMSRAFVKVNLALFHLKRSQERDVLQLLDSARDNVDATSFDRVRQKYFLAAAILRCLLDSDEHEIRSLLRSAVENPDRMSPQTTLNTISKIRDHLSDEKTLEDSELLSLLPTCRLSYWYQDPLALMSEPILPSDAGGEDVFY